MADAYIFRIILGLFFGANILVCILLQYSGMKWFPCHIFEGEPHSAQDSECFHNKFNDTLLVIAFNFPLYRSLPLLFSMYSKVFPNIYICGPSDSINSTKNTLGYTVNRFPIHKGYFAYECVSEAAARYRNYSGYLLLMDDVLLNWWTLNELDFTRLWEGPKEPIEIGRFSPPSKWYWWRSRWGKQNCQRAFNEINQLYKDSVVTALLAKEMLSTLRQNGRGLHRCFRGRSDIFYVPSKYITRFSMLSSIFRKHEVFLEIAVPTIFRLLDISDTFEQLHGYYLPGRVGEEPVKDGRYFWTIYNEELNFLHPLKLHYGANSTMSLAIIENWYLAKVGQLANCKRSSRR